ncbi:MAG: sensor histidine kinase KdpD [Azospirillaceae bacterium]|nr:sensor histidine kinase KdpD [Azospirillaceae bacterium]
MSTEKQRPSPDALLEQVKRETRGRLKIFLGAAPGVGKTYEMLQSAHAAVADGIDVAIGVVECHGRSETEALVRGLEVIANRRVDYRGRVLEEMDIDAVLRRHPKLVLVDELAHTNVPGSRHLKRYQDVDELLDAGIDVLSTVNIQHIESLNDVIARITRVRVRETLPDSVLEAADEIELVDLTPQELIKRLSEGKIYVPEQAKRALLHYFSPGNLTALRELALRRTAQRVDEQMLSYMRQHAIVGPWATDERILVCISGDERAAALVRYGKRVADRVRAKWTVLMIETARQAQQSEAERDRVADTLRLAERLGASTVTLPGRRVAEDILAYAQEYNITQIILGKTERSRWADLVRGSVTRDLLRHAGSISVHIMAGDGGDDPLPPKTVKTRDAPRTTNPFAANPIGYIAATLFVALALGAGELIQIVANVSNVALAFLMSVLGSAVLYGLGPSFYAALLSVVAYNFFFLPPLYTFTIADPANVIALCFFLVAAVLTSQLATIAQFQIEAAKRRTRITAELYGFARKLAGIGKLDDLLWATAHQFAVMLQVRVVILMPPVHRADAPLRVCAGYPPEDQLDDGDLAAAQWAWNHNRAAGRGADTLPGARRLFMPMRTERGPLAVIGIDADVNGPILTPDGRRLFDALSDQAAIAIERVALAEDLDEVRIMAETEKLRSALLTSISHDLRTPLASIIGAATGLVANGDNYASPIRAELASTVLTEAERLNRFIGNLLDMTRLESGAIHAKREAFDVEDVVGTALERCRQILAGHKVKVAIPRNLPLVVGDFLLIEQILVNLLDNAGKYAPAGTTIRVEAVANNGSVSIAVADEGPGIPAEATDLIFNKFYRVTARDRQVAGTGLGLAVCRGFAEAMGGTVIAANRHDRLGALLTLTLPASTAATLTDEVLEANAAAEAGHPEISAR